MDHTPYGYRIINGKAVINEQAAERIKILFQSYLTGDSLATAAKKAEIIAFHAGVSRLLQNKRYLGDEYYPALIDPDTFTAAEAERIRRAEKLGRVREPKVKKRSSIQPPSVSAKAQNSLTTHSSRRNTTTV